MYALSKKIQTGTQAPRPRWPRLVREVDGAEDHEDAVLGQAVAASDPALALVREAAVEPGFTANPSADLSASPNIGFSEDPDSGFAASPSVGLSPRSDHDLSLDPEGDLTTDPDDELFLLGERCAQAYIEADALHYRAMKLLAEFHRREGWKNTIFSSTAEWLAWRIGIQLHAARERVRTAVALQELPQTSAAMQQGELSYTKVRSLTRVATADNEAALLELARAGSAANLERVVRGWKKLDGKSELKAEQIRHRSRRFSAWVDEDGMVVVRGRLDPEVGAVFMRAVEAASDALFRSEARSSGEEESIGKNSAACNCHEPGQPTAPSRDREVGLPETTPRQRRADAVGLLAERALAAGFGVVGPELVGSGAGESGAGGLGTVGIGAGAGDGTASGARAASSTATASAEITAATNRTSAAASEAPISGSRAERYQVMLHVDASTLEEEGETGQSELDDGTRVTAVTSRRISCDAGLVKIVHGADGQVLGAGRRTRTVPPSLRRALEARDRGCQFPGCGLRFTDAHHVKHWADGGETTLRNLVLLCRRHHRAVHEGGVKVCLDRDGQVVFFGPRGRALLGAPPRRLERGNGTGARVEKNAAAEEMAETATAGVVAEEKTAEEQAVPETAAAKNTAPAETAAARIPRPEPSSIKPNTGIPRWARDHAIPWEVEARAWEALDSG